MRTSFISAAAAALLFVSQTHAWGCIGKDCSESTQGGQIAFSAPSVDESSQLAPPGAGWVWSSCGEGDEVVTVDSILVSPDPPKPGQNLTVKAKGTLSQDVSVSRPHSTRIVSPLPVSMVTDPPPPSLVTHTTQDGTFADVVVKLGLIKLLTRRFDVCEEARANNAELQCPLGPGEYELTHTVALPREIPPGKLLMPWLLEHGPLTNRLPNPLASPSQVQRSHYRGQPGRRASSVLGPEHQLYEPLSCCFCPFLLQVTIQSRTVHVHLQYLVGDRQAPWPSTVGRINLNSQTQTVILCNPIDLCRNDIMRLQNVKQICVCFNES